MTEKITSNQRKQIVRFAEDAVFMLVNIPKVDAQRLIENGGACPKRAEKACGTILCHKSVPPCGGVLKPHLPQRFYRRSETSIAEQVLTIATIFGLDPTQAFEFAKNLPTLPEGAELWFDIPKVPAVAKQFPAIY